MTQFWKVSVCVMKDEVLKDEKEKDLSCCIKEVMGKVSFIRKNNETVM